MSNPEDQLFPEAEPLQEPLDTEPAHFIYGHPQSHFNEGEVYNMNGYMYRFIGMRYDEFGQSLPFLELASKERVAPGSPYSKRTYAPKFVVKPHEPITTSGQPTVGGVFQVSQMQDTFGVSAAQSTDEQYYAQSSAQSASQTHRPLISETTGQPFDQPFVGEEGQDTVQPFLLGSYAQSSGQPELNPYAQSFVPSSVRSPAVASPEPELKDVTVRYKRSWKLRNTFIKNIIELNDKNLPPPQDRTADYLMRIINESEVNTESVELCGKQPLALICEVKRPKDSIGDHFAVAFDKTENGYMSAVRPIKESHLLDVKVLCVDENGKATPQKSYDFSGSGQGINVRVLIVGQNGWLVYFGADRPWILTEFKYLVFTSSKSPVLSRRVLDTKRTDGNEAFLSQTILSPNPPVDGMSISSAIVQRDTTKDGTFVITGTGNSIIAMTQMQVMLKSGQHKEYYDKPMPPESSRHESLSHSQGPSGLSGRDYY